MYDYCTFDIEGLVVFVDGTKHILSRYVLSIDICFISIL